MNAYPHIILHAQRDVSVRRRHPWVFSGAIARVEGKPQPGALVAIHSADGTFLAWGHYSAASQIRARLFAWENEDFIPETTDFWRARLERAIAARKSLLVDGNTTACRLVNAESDGIPGLVVDRYGDVVVVQYLSAGAEARRELFNTLLLELLHPVTLYERSDVDVREKERLAPRAGLLAGDEPPAVVEIRENGLHFGVDVRHGHKTGFYLDQRDNRARLRAAVAQCDAPTVLNVFAYSGGFAVYALAGGASAVTNVDTSAEALRLGRENLARNGFTEAAVEDIEGDAFMVLRELHRQKHAFDVVILDPPKFAFTQSDVKKATRGYKDINMQAMRLLRPGGLLFTFSCSGAISADLFQKIVFGAALDVQRDLQIIGRMTQSSDHPVALTFPEGEYLKGLICRVVGESGSR
ncbi:MAG TPA: class I SAM-dependent rRNA methyltransferase [Anaerolineae bacterium]|nr:class I SAM-dependent rRNA methyltransferase [Anaerolineae bacterium]HQK12756.1 class I SAM-dependent rRNA methyltransferase [Anaerolineae bacterium]